MTLHTAPPPAIDTLIEQAQSLLEREPAQAVALADQALAAMAASGTPDGAPGTLPARARRVRGLALHYAGRHADGLAELNRALVACPPDALATRADVLRSLSIGCELFGALDDSLRWATQALDAARQLGDPAVTAKVRLAVGVACSRCGDAAAGIVHLREALAGFEALSNRFGCISSLNSIGINLMELGQHDESAAQLTHALALADQPGDDIMTASVRANLGETLWRMGRLSEAHDALAGAIEVMQRHQQREAEAEARIKLGGVRLALGQADAAREELEVALALLASVGTLNYTAGAHQALAELHEHAGRFDAALRHHKAFRDAERAQFNDASDRRVSALRVQLEVADARHEAEVHQLKHVQIAKAHVELQELHAALTAADAEKNLLLVRLAEQTRTDALTGLANRRRLDEWLANELARARRHGQPLAVAMCDLDFFKRINDRLGHATGDTVLRTVARLLNERCRTTDLVARYGGEEFCIAFPQTGGAAAAQLCEALRDAVASFDWQAVHPELSVTMSIGVSDDLTLIGHERLLADADTHLYRAKRDGKNRVRWNGN